MLISNIGDERIKNLEEGGGGLSLCLYILCYRIMLVISRYTSYLNCVFRIIWHKTFLQYKLHMHIVSLRSQELHSYLKPLIYQFIFSKIALKFLLID